MSTPLAAAQQVAVSEPASLRDVTPAQWRAFWAVMLGWIVYAMTYVLFAVSPSPIMTWLVFALYGVYYGLTEGAEKAVIASTCPKEAHGKAFGLLAAITGAALLPANLIFGLLYERDTALAFGVTAGIAAAGALLLLALAGRDIQGASAA